MAERVSLSLFKLQQYLTLTPHMTKMKLILFLNLPKLSKHPKWKLYLIEYFIPEITNIIDIQSSSYAKEKLLDIVASVCSVDDAIKIIGKDRKLVEFIFRSFSNCNNNFRLQKMLFKLLTLIACNIQSDPKSDWIDYLTNSRYFLGNNIIRIMTNLTAGSPLTEIIVMLESLSNIKMPNGTCVLERLFKIDDLVSVLLKWSFVAFIDSSRDEQIIFQNRWFIIEKWLLVMSAITKLKSFRRNIENDDIENCCDIENNVDRVFMLNALNSVQRAYNKIFTYVFMKFPPNTQESRFFLITLVQNAAAAFCKSVILLLNFPSDNNLPGSVEFIIDNLINTQTNIIWNKPFEAQDVLSDLRRSTKYLTEYCMRYLNQCSFKSIMELLLLCAYIGDNIRKIPNALSTIEMTTSEVELNCWYLYEE